MTIREYFYNSTMTAEEYLERLAEEDELWYTIENDEDFDLNEWARSHGVDLTVVDEKTGETVLTLWQWDMCRE